MGEILMDGTGPSRPRPTSSSKNKDPQASREVKRQVELGHGKERMMKELAKAASPSRPLFLEVVTEEHGGPPELGGFQANRMALSLPQVSGPSVSLKAFWALALPAASARKNDLEPQLWAIFLPPALLVL